MYDRSQRKIFFDTYHIICILIQQHNQKYIYELSHQNILIYEVRIYEVYILDISYDNEI